MSRPTLPNIEFKNWRGLYTKGAEDVVNPFQLRVSSNTDSFRQYGAISKVRGNKPVITDQQVDGNGDPKPISWIGFYKAADLDGRIIRRTLLASGSDFLVLKSDGSVIPVPLPPNLEDIPRVPGLPHVAATQNGIIFIQNQDPRLVGNGNIPLKYAGYNIYRWGCLGPGFQEYLVYIDDPADIHCSTGDSFVYPDTDISLDTYGTTLHKETTTTNRSYIDFVGLKNSQWDGSVHSYPYFSINSNLADRAAISIYISRAFLEYLRQVDANGVPTYCMAIYLTSADPTITYDANTIFTDYTWKYQYSIGDFIEGWNRIPLSAIGDSPPAGVTAPANRYAVGSHPIDPSAVTSLRVEVFTAENSTVFPVPTPRGPGQALGIDHLVVYDQGSIGYSTANLTVTDAQISAGDLLVLGLSTDELKQISVGQVVTEPTPGTNLENASPVFVTNVTTSGSGPTWENGVDFTQYSPAQYNTVGCSVSVDSTALKITPTATVMDACTSLTDWSSSYGTLSLENSNTNIRFDANGGGPGPGCWRSNYTSVNLNTYILMFDILMYNQSDWYNLTATTGFEITLYSGGGLSNYKAYSFGTDTGINTSTWITVVMDPYSQTPSSSGGTYNATANTGFQITFPSGHTFPGPTYPGFGIKNIRYIRRNITCQINSMNPVADMSTLGSKQYQAKPKRAGLNLNSNPTYTTPSTIKFSNWDGSGTTPPPDYRKVTLGTSTFTLGAYPGSPVTLSTVADTTPSHPLNLSQTACLNVDLWLDAAYSAQPQALLTDNSFWIKDVTRYDGSSAPSVTLSASPSYSHPTVKNTVNPATLTFNAAPQMYQIYGSGGTQNVFTPGYAYTYRFTFLTKFGLETNAGPPSAAYTIYAPPAYTSGDSTVYYVTGMELTNIPVSHDPQVIARRIYRTVGGGSVWLRLGQISDNVTTTYTDTTADISLSDYTPPLAGDASFDSSPPPQAGILRLWKKTLFLAGDPLNPYMVYFSEPDEPEQFPLINQFQLDSPITSMYETYSSLIIETATGKWQVTGDGPDFNFDKVIEGMGTVGARASGTCRVIGWCVDVDGMRLYDSSNNPYKVSEPIRDKYDALDKTYSYRMNTVHVRKNSTLLQFNPRDNSTDVHVYDPVFQYQYVVDNPNIGFWSTFDIKDANGDLLVNILDTEEIEDENGNWRVLGSTDDGMVYELFAEDTKAWWYLDPNDSYARKTAPIITTFTSPWLRIGEIVKVASGEQSATGRTRPRYIEVRATGDATTWDITLDTSEGQASSSPSDTTTVSFNFPAGSSLMRLPVTSDFTPREYFRVTATNATLGPVDGNGNYLGTGSTILALRVFFMPPEEGQYIVPNYEPIYGQGSFTTTPAVLSAHE